MKRPLKPVRTPTVEEHKRERRFTRRMIALALVSGLFGGCINLVKTMGRPAMPRPPGAAPPPQLPPGGTLGEGK